MNRPVKIPLTKVQEDAKIFKCDMDAMQVVDFIDALYDPEFVYIHKPWVIAKEVCGLNGDWVITIQHRGETMYLANYLEG